MSPIVDCFFGYLPTWTIGIHPNADLVNTILDHLAQKLGTEKKPILHTDRECHYRWHDWIKRRNENGWTRSMLKKGYSPDNLACEGLFGRIKNEFFYGRDWMGVSFENFMKELDE